MIEQTFNNLNLYFTCIIKLYLCYQNVKTLAICSSADVNAIYEGH